MAILLFFFSLWKEMKGLEQSLQWSLCFLPFWCACGWGISLHAGCLLLRLEQCWADWGRRELSPPPSCTSSASAFSCKYRVKERRARGHSLKLSSGSFCSTLSCELGSSTLRQYQEESAISVWRCVSEKETEEMEGKDMTVLFHRETL